MEKYEWKTKKYDWGEIGKLKSKYRNGGVKKGEEKVEVRLLHFDRGATIFQVQV